MSALEIVPLKPTWQLSFHQCFVLFCFSFAGFRESHPTHEQFSFLPNTQGDPLQISGALSQHSSLLFCTLLLKLQMFQVHQILNPVSSTEGDSCTLLTFPSLHCCLQSVSYRNPGQSQGLLPVYPLVLRITVLCCILFGFISYILFIFGL